MPLVSKSISNLINGVSQQPDALRLPSQAELQVNLYPSVVEGLKDRPPTESIAKIYNGTLPAVHVHTINRDATKRYTALITSGDLQVNDIDGTLKTITFPNGKAYLTAATPQTDFVAMTVADYTFLVNRTITVAMKAGLSTIRAKEGLIFVKQGNYGSTYKVFIDGTQRATYTTSNTVVTDIATDNIAEQLRSQLAAWAGANYTITRQGSVVSLVKVTTDFILTSTDSQGGSSLFAFKNTTQSFSALPTIAPNGFEIGITNSPGSEVDNYYLRFATTDASTFGEGVWNECVAQGVAYQLDPTTMPHVLIRNGDGTFTFQEATWTDMTVGNSLTAPQPSFVGSTINEIAFFKNRLTFWSDDNTIASEVGLYFNFFKTTVTTNVDSDPIDTRVNHTKVSIINHAVPFDSQMLLFSDQTQFDMIGVPTLSAKTISILPTTEFENSPTCKPVSAGRRAYFITENGLYNGLREYSIDNVQSTKDAVNVTGHVPKYIPAGAFKIAASTVEDLVVVLTTGDPTAIYLYKYFYAQDEKLQSAWCKFTMGGAGTVVLGAEFIQNYLYLTIQRTGGVYYERINFAPGVVDAGVNFLTHYDRRITEAQCTSVTFAAGVTTWNLPYTVDGTMAVVTRTTNPGQQITLTFQSGTQLKATGDYTATTVFIGQLYTRTYRFSKFYVREQTKSGEGIVMNGRLQLRNGKIVYADTGTFTVTVTQDYRSPNSFVAYRDPQDAVFTGRILGAGSNLLGAVALASGEFSFPIQSRNTQVTIEISSTSFLPMHISGAEWEGFFHPRSRRT